MKSPSWAGFVPDVIHAKVMHNHHAPVITPKLFRHMSCDIVVDFCEILLAMST